MARRRAPIGIFTTLIVASGCTDAPRAVGDTGESSAEASEPGARTGSDRGDVASGSDGGAETGASRGDGASSTSGQRFDVAQDTEIPELSCKVVDGLDAIPECEQQGPPDAFDPEIEWSWNDDATPQVSTIPLVANLTDDDGNGAIDLCDVPDVVVVAGPNLGNPIDAPGYLFLLSGDDGRVHWQSQGQVYQLGTAALGDIDNDGLPEILAFDLQLRVVAFEHDGTPKWTSEQAGELLVEDRTIALADLDADGDVEIMGSGWVHDHEGNALWQVPFPEAPLSASTAATAQIAVDLDGDDDLELVIGSAGYDHDGTERFNQHPAVAQGFPQAADFDGDDAPEILVTNRNGLTLLEADGSVVFADERPTGVPAQSTNWVRPATIHDFDGDGFPDFATSSRTNYAAYDRTAKMLWWAPVADETGLAAGTAFDFLGDGTAEPMYADESTLFVYDEKGLPLFSSPRSSGTTIEYPVVADVDNDQSAEILVVSNAPWGGAQTAPALQVLRDREDRWIGARRIWNQHSYHVTNVREDGTIPQHEPKHWRHLNTWRTQAQLEVGRTCRPIPAG